MRDDDEGPTVEEVEASLNKVLALVQYLQHNAIGYEEEGEKAEARKFRKCADRILAATAAHDLTSIRKLTSSPPLIADEYLTDRALDPLSYGWARR